MLIFATETIKNQIKSLEYLKKAVNDERTSLAKDCTTAKRLYLKLRKSRKEKGKTSLDAWGKEAGAILNTLSATSYIYLTCFKMTQGIKEYRTEARQKNRTAEERNCADISLQTFRRIITIIKAVEKGKGRDSAKTAILSPTAEKIQDGAFRKGNRIILDTTKEEITSAVLMMAYTTDSLIKSI